jgi:peroxiredoxin
MNRSRVILVVFALCSALAGFLLSRATSSPAPHTVTTMETPPPLPAVVDVRGMHRPDFSLADFSGNIRRLDEWDGKVIAVNFWASWCAPCLQEIPELVELQHRYGDRGFQILGIALQKPEELGEFVVEYKMNYPVLAGETAVIKIAEDFGNSFGALPYTAIIDRAGKIVFVKAGPVTGKEVEDLILPLL